MPPNGAQAIGPLHCRPGQSAWNWINWIFWLHREHPWAYRIRCLYWLGSPTNTVASAGIKLVIISRRFFSFNVMCTTLKRLMNTDSVRLFKWVECNTEQIWSFVSTNVVYVRFWHVPFTRVPIYLLFYLLYKKIFLKWMAHHKVTISYSSIAKRLCTCICTWMGYRCVWESERKRERKGQVEQVLAYYLTSMNVNLCFWALISADLNKLWRRNMWPDLGKLCEGSVHISRNARS